MKQNASFLMIALSSVFILAGIGRSTAQTPSPATQPTAETKPKPAATPSAKTAEEWQNESKRIFRQVRDSFEKHLRDRLGTTDDEWKVLLPKIEKVSKLGQEAGTAKWWLPDAEPPDLTKPPTQTDMMKASQNLQKILINPDVKTEDLQAAMKAYRDAKAATKEKLVKAQAELKELLTVKQEATLLSMGLLE